MVHGFENVTYIRVGACSSKHARAGLLVLERVARICASGGLRFFNSVGPALLCTTFARRSVDIPCKRPVPTHSLPHVRWWILIQLVILFWTELGCVIIAK